MTRARLVVGVVDGDVEVHVVEGGVVGELDGADVPDLALAVVPEEFLGAALDAGEGAPLPHADGDGLSVDDLRVTPLDVRRLSGDASRLVRVPDDLNVLRERWVELVGELHDPDLVAPAVSAHVADDGPNLRGEASVPAVWPGDSAEVGEDHPVLLRVVVGCLGVAVDEVLELQLLGLRRGGEALPDLLDDRLLLLGRRLLKRLCEDV